MDIIDLHSLSTVLVFLAFVGICWWAFSPRRKKRFEEAAKLPFSDDDLHRGECRKSDESDTPDKT